MCFNRFNAFWQSLFLPTHGLVIEPPIDPINFALNSGQTVFNRAQATIKSGNGSLQAGNIPSHLSNIIGNSGKPGLQPILNCRKSLFH